MFNRAINRPIDPDLLLADGEASWSLILSLVPLLPGSIVQPEDTYSHIPKVAGQVLEI